ncbi:MAG TPA: alpha-N-acetylglucosaminidase C-terminal domain-containing protein, partial [Flavobacterium sp.]
RTGYEKQLAEKNARMQITFWGPSSNPNTKLHEYAHKEWSGLIKDLYEPRWQLFFEQLDNELAGRPFREVDFFALESKWAREQRAYATIPKGNYLEVIQEIVAFCKIE